MNSTHSATETLEAQKPEALIHTLFHDSLSPEEADRLGLRLVELLLKEGTSWSTSLLADALSCLSQPQVFDFLMRSKEKGLLMAALTDLRREGLLFEVVETHENPDIARLAVQKIARMDLLEKLLETNLEKEGRDALKSALEARIAALRALSVLDAQYLKIRDDLLLEIEKCQDLALEARLSELKSRLETHLYAHDVEGMAALKAAISRAERRKSQWQSSQAQEKAAQESQKEAELSSRASLSTLEGLIADLQRGVASSDKAELEANLLALRSRLDGILGGLSPEARASGTTLIAWAESFVHAMSRLLAQHELIRSLIDWLSRLSAEAESVPMADAFGFLFVLRQLKSEFDSSLFEVFSILSEVKALEAAREADGSLQKLLERRVRLVTYLGSRLDEIESRLSSHEYRKLLKQVEKVVSKFEILFPEERRPLEIRAELLKSRIETAESQHTDTILPLQEALCLEAEALISKSFTSATELLSALQRLQARWKEVSKGIAKQMYWSRFNMASQALYQHYESLFGETQKTKEENAKIREHLASEAEAWVERGFSEVVWRELATFASQTWKAWHAARPYAPLGEEARRARLSAAMKKIQAELDAHYHAMAQAKQALIERAQALLPLEPLEAAKAAKEIQAQWRKIEHSGHREALLWEQFSSVCGEIFGRAKSSSPLRERTQSPELQQLNTLLEQYNQAIEEKRFEQCDALEADIEGVDVTHLPERLQESLQKRITNLKYKRRAHAGETQRGGSPRGGASANPRREREPRDPRESAGSAAKPPVKRYPEAIEGLQSLFRLEVDQRFDEARLKLKDVSHKIPPVLRELLGARYQPQAPEADVLELRALCVEGELLASLPSEEGDEALRKEVQLKLLERIGAQGMDKTRKAQYFLDESRGAWGSWATNMVAVSLFIRLYRALAALLS